jgi:hypothetical protein
MSDHFWPEHRRRLIQEARVATEVIGGRMFVVRHLPPIHPHADAAAAVFDA